MKKLIMVLIMAAMALILLPISALADETLDLKDGSIELFIDGKSLGYKQGNVDKEYTGTLTITENDTEVVDGTRNTITVVSGRHDVQLNSDSSTTMHICLTAYSPIKVSSNCLLRLTVKGAVILDTTPMLDNYCAALHVAPYAWVEIITEENAMLTVNSRGAGIGGNVDEQCGDIVLAGKGSIIATGGVGSAGIGGGKGGSSGRIIINGGTITATGGINAAGIGGGYKGNGDVTIKMAR